MIYGLKYKEKHSLPFGVPSEKKAVWAAVFFALFLVATPQSAWASEAASVAPEAPLAMPERTLDLAEMPEMTPVSSLKGPTTEQENASYLKEKLDLSLPQGKEKDPSEKIVGDFKIRFAPLPNSTIRSIPDIRISNSMTGQRSYARTAAQKAKQDKATEKQLKVLAEMRKRELEALESDRKTLAALRAALKDLGLQKQLSFLSKGKSDRGIESELAGKAAAAETSAD